MTPSVAEVGRMARKMAKMSEELSRLASRMEDISPMADAMRDFADALHSEARHLAQLNRWSRGAPLEVLLQLPRSPR